MSGFWARIKALLFALLAAYALAVVVYGLFFAANDEAPRVGDRCGPNHRWTYIWPPWNPELSCEEE